MRLAEFCSEGKPERICSTSSRRRCAASMMEEAEVGSIRVQVD
jgi:hypothetical protein